MLRTEQLTTQKKGIMIKTSSRLRISLTEVKRRGGVNFKDGCCKPQEIKAELQIIQNCMNIDRKSKLTEFEDFKEEIKKKKLK